MNCTLYRYRPIEVLSELKFHDHQGRREKVIKLLMPNITIIIGHYTLFNLSGSGRVGSPNHRVNCHRVGLGYGSICLTRFHLWPIDEANYLY